MPIEINQKLKNSFIYLLFSDIIIVNYIHLPGEKQIKKEVNKYDKTISVKFQVGNHEKKITPRSGVAIYAQILKNIDRGTAR